MTQQPRATIRPEAPADQAAVRTVNERAFGQPDEADLVDALRANGGVSLSLVATVGGAVVGHILFSPATIEDEHGSTSGAALAPMAVMPEFQRQGIGSALIEEGVSRLRQGGTPFIVVVGHPEYYPRFGFVPARLHGLRCAWQVPDESFMVLILDPGRGVRGSGMIAYRHEFSRIA